MTRYNVRFKDKDGFVMGTTVEARDPEHALEKALGLKGEKFTTRNEIVADAIERGDDIKARVVPQSKDYIYSSASLKRGLQEGKIRKDDPESDLESGDRTGLTTRKG